MNTLTAVLCNLMRFFFTGEGGEKRFLFSAHKYIESTRGLTSVVKYHQNFGLAVWLIA